MPLDLEDTTADITGNPTPARALTKKETTQAQKQQAQVFQPPPPQGQVVPSPEGSKQLSDQPQVNQQQDQGQQSGQAPQKEAPDGGQSQGKGWGKINPVTVLPPAYQKYAANPWLALDDTKMGAETLWNLARHAGAGWNALTDPTAMSAAQHDIWSRNDAAAKALQFVEAGYQGQQNPAQAEWFWENFGSAIVTAPAYINPISGTALLGLSLAGGAPEDPTKIPGAIAGGLPLAELGTVAQHPEQIKDPAVASRLFWKSANALLIGASVLPMTRWLKGLNLIKPEVLQEIEQGSARVKAMQPGDPGALPDGEALKRALSLPPVGDESLVAKTAKRDIRQMEVSPTGEYMDITLRQRAKIRKALGYESAEDLPHVAPNWSAAQVKLARKVLPQWLPYDLTRVHGTDLVPENPYLFMDQLAEEAGPSAMRYMAAFNHAHLQILRGPVIDPLNAAESMVHSLPSVHTGTRFIMEKFFAAEEELMAKAGVDDKLLMKAVRDPETYAALSPAAKMIVNSQKILRRVYADQARQFGHREGFVPNYDPRVKIPEEAPVGGARAGRGTKTLTGESKAHREEAFVAHPDRPGQVALAEKYQNVFDLNSAMRELRQAHVTNATKSSARRELEAKALNRRENWYDAMKAQEALDRMDAEGMDLPTAQQIAEATIHATRRYPLYFEGLHASSMRSLPNQIMALHSHIALPQMLNALAHDGNPLALAKSAREIPPGYKALENASKAFEGYVFHPDIAGPLNRISAKAAEGGVFNAWVKMNELSVAALMFSPMIHGDNMVGRMAWLLSKHALGPEAGKVVEQAGAAMAHSKPWAMLEKVMGIQHGSELDRLKWQMKMEMEAIDAGVIPHFQSRGLSNLLYSEYGKAIGDATAFEGPGTREAWRLPPAFKNIEGAARATGQGYEWLQNLLWGRIVFPTGVFAFHLERAAVKAANPGIGDLAADQYAAHMANRWQGAIEPMARSQAMNTLWRSMGFAINWVRSFYELALPSYLSKSAVAAYPQLRGYVLRQELQSMMGMLAAQHISGNILNMILSGHPQWENDPDNRYGLEITRPEIIKGLQALGLYKNVDPLTGRDPETGGRLVAENPVARQQLQLERMLGMESGVTPKEGVQDMVAGHLAPIVDTLAAAFNVNLPQTILAGTPRYIDGHANWEYPWESNLWATLAQFGGVGSTVGRQVALDASGRPIKEDTTMPDWLKNAPVPDAVKRYAAPTAQTAWNWMTGIRAPYLKVEKTEGATIPDQNYAAYQDLSTKYDTDMTQWSTDLMTGKVTPYEWRQFYSARAHDYSVRLDQLFSGAPEYKQGALGLYSGYQNLYDQAQLPDGSGVDWGKLDGLQADYMQHLTAAQRADLQTQISKHENAYPALGMYRSTLNAHADMAKAYAQQAGISYGTLMTELQEARALDNQGYRQYLGSHPDLAGYFQAQTQWEVNTWPGRLYSLYYHTAALQRWLIPQQGETEQAAEERAAGQIEQHYSAPTAPAA